MLFEESESHENSGDSLAAAQKRAWSAEYGRIVDSREKFSRSNCVALVLDKNAGFQEQIIAELDTLPPELAPLNILVVLVENLGALVEQAYKSAYEIAEEFVYGATL